MNGIVKAAVNGTRIDGDADSPVNDTVENKTLKVEMQKSLRAATMEVAVGHLKGQRVSVWDVLSSSYLVEARRRELLEQFGSGALTLSALVAALSAAVEDTEQKAGRVSFRGLRRQVSASQLCSSKIISIETLRDLAKGTKTMKQVTEMDSVKRYLEGTSCIAGVLVPSREDPTKQEKMTIYQAMWKGILRPGTALVLLEAQAATGFVIDPLGNRRLSVEEAVAADVVGGELREKLLSAERAVTGYTDPYTGEPLSLFQAMKRDLIVKDHGIRLLEAQIATGGVVDPVHSHRVPVEVAYQRGYFDEEMNRILSDPSDDTKGFFDPNTHENLTYLQLLRRCVRDPDTGLSMLQLAAPGSPVFQLSEQMRVALQSAPAAGSAALFQGQTVSVWEFLFSSYVTEARRQELLGGYRARTLGLEELGATLSVLVAEATARHGQRECVGAGVPARPTPEEVLGAATMEVRLGPLRGPEVSVWRVLSSEYLRESQRQELLDQFGSGTLALPALTRRLSIIIEETEQGRAGLGPDVEAALRAATMEVAVGQFNGQRVSVWDVLSSSYLVEARRRDLLERFGSGALTMTALVDILTSAVEDTERKAGKVSFRGLRRQVSASQLCSSKIISIETLRDLAEGTKTMKQVTEMDSVKRYLEGTSCIAGVLVPSREDPTKQEKMTIYQAMWKGILRPGTALVLLEAQAATGFVIDPLGNRRLSVEEAVAADVVGGELREKLLSAERAVTGYTDPYTGEPLSLFQAMKRDLIVKDHGIRLLEAQIATGGVVDPVHSHRVPVEVAYQRGYFDEEMNRILSDPSDDTKGFFDPNTHENLTYLQLLRRCVRDPDTGLSMLQLAAPGSPVFQLSEQMRVALQSAPAAGSAALFQGQTVSVWEFLFSSYVTEARRQELLGGYRARTLGLEELGATLSVLVAEATARHGQRECVGAGVPARPTPEEVLGAATMEVRLGPLRGPSVSVWRVLSSEYLRENQRQELLDQFGSGTLALPALTRRLAVIIEETEQGQAGPGPDVEAALRAATMKVTMGQFNGQPVSVWDVLFSSYLDEAGRQDLLERFGSGALTMKALVDILTSAVEDTERKAGKVSFRGLRRQVSALQLCDSKIISIETLRHLAEGTKTIKQVTEMDSVKRYLEGTSCIAGVLVPSREDPTKQEKMTIYQAMWKGILRPGTALVLLEAQAATGFVIDPLGNRRLSVEEAVAAGVVGGELREKLLSAERAVTGYTDPYTGEPLSLFQAMKRDLIVKDHGIRLLEAQIATGGVVDPVHSHRVPVEVAYQRGYFDEEMNRILSDPSDDTKGFFDPNTHENLTYLQLLRRCVRDPDTGLSMLQLAAPGSPVFQLSEQMRVALQSAPAAGSAALFQGQTVSVWEFLFSSYVTEARRQELLGGYRARTLGLEELGATLSVLVAEATARHGQRECVGAGVPARPTPEEVLGAATMEVRLGPLRGPEVSVWRVLSSEYLRESQRQELLDQFGSGTLALPALTRRLSIIIEETEQGRAGLGPDVEAALRAATMEVAVGQFNGQRVSVWDVLSSSYLVEARRRDLLERFGSGALTMTALVDILTSAVEDTERKAGKVSFRGLRRQVSASQLCSSKIISIETLRDLAEGTKTMKQVTEMDSVKRYLEGTSCIAGVLVPSREDPTKQEKMTIYQAMWKGILRPGTALVLLEAQAATGFVIDPLGNRRLSVEEAVAAGVVGGELREKLLSAERAVTGYTDPYTGEPLSLFQAMKRDLIVKDHGIRLLEAQIATGGVVDPVHSHRVPVEVAYQRGYFDEEMNRILSDPSDDTKGFFDPNTHENLTYLQLLRRCVRDPDTGLSMLQLAAPGSPVFQLSEQMRVALQSAPAAGSAALFQGQTVSVWEFLFSSYVTEARRQELLGGYRARTLGLEELGATLSVLVAEARARHGQREGVGLGAAARPTLQEVLGAATMEVRFGPLRGPSVSVWRVLSSEYLRESQRQELLDQFGSGTLALPALTRRLAVIIEETEQGQAGPGPDVEAALRAATMKVTMGQFNGQPVSVWDVLFSSYLDEAGRQDLLERFGSGALTMKALVDILTSAVEDTERKAGKVSFRGLRRQVSALQLCDSKIISIETLRHLAEGTKTIKQVTEMDSVKRYLEGTSCIAGVLVPSREDPTKQEKMTIYQAMWKGILRPGTALVLLEAQAATGFVIDPLGNRRLSVEEAVAAGVVGGELREKLLSAERAVTGYTDPYTGEPLSLFQAMKRDLIVKDHGIRLLEAQIATGGVVDPVHSHRVPVEVAYQRGYFDEEMNRILSDPSDDTKGFFDPNTHENLTYLQLLRRCVRDPDTGLSMLQLAAPGSPVFQLSEQMRVALQSAPAAGSAALFQGQTVSVWEFLFSSYVTEARRQELLGGYRARTLGLEELGATLSVLVAEATARHGQRECVGAGVPARPTPEEVLGAATMEVRLGPLRGPEVSVWRVLSSEYLRESQRQELLDQFGSGTLALPALTRRLSIIIEETEQGRAGPGPDVEAALRAATMEVAVGQFNGQRVSVWDVLSSSYLVEARRRDLLERFGSGALTMTALVDILTSAVEDTERKAGKVSFRGLRRQVSASQLCSSKIISIETLRDLAEGTKTMKQVTEMDSVKRYLEGTSCIAGVLVPSREDPTKQEKMTIYQAMWKGILRPGTALVLLEAQAATGFVIDPLGNRRLSVEEAVAAGVVGGELREKLLSAERAVTGYTDPYTGEPLSLFQAMKRDLIVKDHGIRLLEAQIATGGVVDPVHSHRVPVEVAYQRGYFDEEMNRILSDPSDDTKGFFDPNTHENLTYLQRLRRCVRDPDTGLSMLQLAAPGSPVFQLSEQMRVALQSAPAAGSAALFQGQTVSVWEFLFSSYVTEARRQELLGGYRARTLGLEELGATLSVLVAEATARHGQRECVGAGVPARPTLQEVLGAATMEVRLGPLRGPEVSVWRVLSSEYLRESQRQELLDQFGSGTLALPALTRRLSIIIEETEQGRAGLGPDVEAALRAATMEVAVGQFNGQRVSVWDVLSSSYLVEARRRDLLERFGSGALTMTALVDILTSAVEDTERKAGKVSFRGLRRQVSASQLCSSKIISIETLRDLAEGTKTMKQVTEMDSVKRYLEGTSCIAGVLVPSREDPTKQEKMTIYQAMWKGILRPGTALVLLEAQAATGFVIDPLGNRRLSVEEAVAADVVGGELREKLLSAERAVTGYTDPYTGEPLSLFQAMKRDLIVKDHGIRLLEAQIATGGVVDPVHSHRVPVEVAYQRGYFDEEMNRILSDPSDDTKGFFDPNTHENLTYLQLLRRCVRDPDTGLSMLQLAAPGSPVFQLSEQMRVALQSAPAAGSAALFQGQTVSVWEFLFSSYVTEARRQELLGGYRARTLGLEELGATLSVLVAEATARHGQREGVGLGVAARPTLQEVLGAATMKVRFGPLRGPSVSVWRVLSSEYLRESQRQELLDQFGSGTLALPALTRRLAVIIEETEQGQAGPGPDVEAALRAATMKVTMGQFNGQPVSVWDVLFSSYLDEAGRQDLLERFGSGALTMKALVDILTSAVEDTERKAGKVSFQGLRRQVSALQLCDSKIISIETLRHLAEGTKTIKQVTEMDSVKRYLEGTSCIAGVLVPSREDPTKQEKMTIYQAMWKGILRPGTALVLLEAQAATGFVIDPLGNRRLSVEEAVAADVVGGELREKLLSAERAVTGYTDPYTGEPLSLFQAMKRDLIVKDHGIRLLEAQIATGGVVDPVHSHRVPVEVAYQRGYFDEEMNRILSDPSDDTKGFFDPNTHENLTYLQLMRRCVCHPDTGLLFLSLK
ncbi:epiplakin [Ornithorhynchus anatinus]|nr:epiplakin [Ornithorhynchus anatinus]